MGYSIRSGFGVAAICVFAAAQSGRAETGFETYGSLNQAFVSVDDGTETTHFYADNGHAPSRVGLWYRGNLEGGGQARFNFETALGFSTSDQASVAENNDLRINLGRTSLRKLEGIWVTPASGTISFGQGSTATDGITESDFSGTDVIAYVGVADLAGGFRFRESGQAPSDISIGDVFNSLDGARRFRLRYDTPSFGGFVFSFSGGKELLNQDDDNAYYGIAARYSEDNGDFTVGGGLGYDWVSGGTETLSGSVAGLHKPTGVSLALASGTQTAGADGAYIYVKLGYQKDWVRWGRSFLSIDYNDGGDFVVGGSDSASVGLAVVQMIDAINLELFAVYRTHKLDTPGTNFQDIDAFAVGARWQF